MPLAMVRPRTLSDLCKKSHQSGKPQTETLPSFTLRQGRLRVDPTRGAGVELRACSTGYKVVKVERVPGQPDLRTGDTIVALEGVMLTGCEEHEIESRFSSGFGHGATLTIVPFTVDLPMPPLLEYKCSGKSTTGLGQVRALAKKLERLDESLSEESPRLRHVSLRVDKVLGAGLELATCSAGYRVNGVDPAPGQPDLRVGSMIVAIDDVILIGLAAEEVEIAFGKAFKDGAQLLVSEDTR